MEIDQENKIDIHFKFGERFAKHIDDYAQENKLSFSARSIESTIYKTDKETVEKNFNDSFVHYDMMKFVLETTGVKLTWYNEPQITKAYFAKQVVKKQRIKHTVKSTDTLESIAENYKTSVEDIIKLNDKKNEPKNFRIKQGQVLDINSSRPEDTNLEYEPITSAKLGESIYVVFETKNMQDKLINIKVKQGKGKGIAEKDQATEMFLHNAFKSDLDMTIGKGAKSSKYKNKDLFLDFAFGKVVLIPNEGSTEKNESKDDKDKIKLKEWNEIINKLQNKSTFLYLYAESKDDAKVFYDGSKKNEFFEVKVSKIIDENLDGEIIKNTNGYFYSYDGMFIETVKNKEKGNQDDVYVCSSKTDKGFENSLKIYNNHNEFATMCNIIKKEGLSSEKNEYLYIAHTNYNETLSGKEKSMYELLMSKYSSVEDKYKIPMQTSESGKISLYSRSGLIDVLLRKLYKNKTDPTYNATQWDGEDFLAWGISTDLKPDSNKKMGHNKFDEYDYVRIKKELYDLFVKKVTEKRGNRISYNSVHDINCKQGTHSHKLVYNQKKKKNDNKAIYILPNFDFSKKEYWLTGDFYFKNKNKQPFGLEATCVAGYTIFWKKIKI